MTIRSKVVCPSGLARLQLGERLVTVTSVFFQETYGGVLEGTPGPELDMEVRAWFLDCLENRWGPRPTCVIEPELVEIQHPRGVMRRMPGVACAAWLTSTPVADAGAASELVLVWWTEALNLQVQQHVELALAGVDWHRVAKDFDY